MSLPRIAVHSVAMVNRRNTRKLYIKSATPPLLHMDNFFQNDIVEWCIYQFFFFKIIEIKIELSNSCCYENFNQWETCPFDANLSGLNDGINSNLNTMVKFFQNLVAT